MGRKEKQNNFIVYRNHFLGVSETFIYNQSYELKRYNAFFLGSKKFKGKNISVPNDRVKYINSGTLFSVIEDYLFKLFGIIPKDLEKWVKQINPSFIHAHFGTDGAIILPLCLKLNIPLIVSLLGSDITIKDEFAKKSFYSQRLFLKKRKQLSEYVSKIIVPSDFLKEKSIKHGFPIEKIHLIAHGVNLEKIRKYDQTPEFGHILFVGRLVPVKGLNFLIEAIKILKEKQLNIFLTIIGDGPMRNEYETLAIEKLKSDFEFLGAQPNDIVHKYLSKTHIFSVPSVSLYSGEVESFGLVFVEAQAYGVPVVSFSCGGIPEVVIHGKTGFLAVEGNYKQLADYILELLSNNEMYEKFRKNAKENVYKNFNLTLQNEKLEAVYDELISCNN